MSLSYGPPAAGRRRVQLLARGRPEAPHLLRRLRAAAAGDARRRAAAGHRAGEAAVRDRDRPVPYVPLEDFDQARLERTEHSTHCPFKGDASYWSVGEHENVVWAYEDPQASAPWLTGYAAVYFNRMDGWLVEDEPVFSAPARPVPPRRRARRARVPVTVSADGEVIAQLRRAAAAVRDRPAGAAVPARATGCRLTRSDEGADARARTRARRPTGRCRGSRTRRGATRRRCPRRQAIAGHVAFDPSLVDVELSAGSGLRERR